MEKMKNNISAYFRNISLFGKSEMFENDQAKQWATNRDNSKSMRKKEMDIYGEERITQQKLYEKWVVKSSWDLHTEAIPLLLSIDPEKYSVSSLADGREEKYQDLREHAQYCVGKGLLAVLNQEQPAEEWMVKPIDVYKWAIISQVEIPEQLLALMEFVMMSLVSADNIKDDPSNKESHVKDSLNRDKEHILGAALSMLVNYPECCKDEKGRVSAENILSLISENKSNLFEKEIPKLSTTVNIDIINHWIMVSVS